MKKKKKLNLPEGIIYEDIMEIRNPDKFMISRNTAYGEVCSLNALS